MRIHRREREAETQPSATPTLSTADTKSYPTSSGIAGTCQWGQQDISRKVVGTVKWFNVRNGYGFINKNDTKEEVFVYQSTIKKNNPRKYLHSVQDEETMESDVDSKYEADHNHYRCYPHHRGLPHNSQQNYQNNKSREKRVLPFHRQGFPPYYIPNPHGCGPHVDQSSNPSVQGEGHTPQFCSSPPCQRQPREKGKEGNKENQSNEAEGQQPPQYGLPANPKSQDGKETKAASPLAENLSTP
ncbi:unnamed protein product [Nyctereutes procyonoides]|uniref:(raccoon dog) hypothetical protein n=1 Tax=Nyctereutes procyonoides TaxID=34880 RepID=A0A811YS83_NYCPR|nr:unnamed protein product [Nyctereutes procyonoides]